MPKPCSRRRDAAAILTVVAILLSPYPASAGGGGLTGGATEWTQLLNNGELVSLVGHSATQIDNQVTQITQLAEQIQNQLRIYQNMLQNTAQLPAHVWGQVQSDLNRLQSVVTKAQGISFSMGNIDDVLSARFKSYSDFKASQPTGQNFSATWQSWSATNRDTIGGTSESRRPHRRAVLDRRGDHVAAAHDVGER